MADQTRNKKVSVRGNNPSYEPSSIAQSVPENKFRGMPLASDELQQR